MAVASLEQSLSSRATPLYAYHHIVHNSRVVESFQRRGVVFVDSLDPIPEGSTVVLSAHGVAPHVLHKALSRNLEIIDTTCPLVTKVHLEARRFASEAYSVVLIGHRGHDEVVGIEGEAPGLIQTIESPNEIDRLVIPDPDRVAVLTQTTLSIDETSAVIEALKSRFPKLRLPPKEDICYATQNRQEALRAILKECQIAIVLGSASSSNSQRLRELAEKVGVRSALVDQASQIDLTWFLGVRSAALTAGASVPEDLVEEILHWLGERFALKIEEKVFKRETVNFLLPVSLLSSSDPAARRIA